MLVRRSKRNHGFTVLSNETIRDPNLSLKATGLLCFLLSFPDDWQINIKHISNNKTDGQSSVQSAINELKAKGYLRKTRVVDDSGKILRWETTVFEHPDLENPDLDFPDLENPVTGSRGDILNTERRIPESKKNCRDQEATATIFSEPVDPAQQHLTAVPSIYPPVQANQPSFAPPLRNVPAETHETQAKTAPSHDHLGRPQRNTSLAAPLQSAQVGNGTPWAPMAPWTSREEYDEFVRFIEARFPGKGKPYHQTILIRVEKGDVDNQCWIDFKAGHDPKNVGAALSVPREWQELLDQCRAVARNPNPILAQIEAIDNFRRLYSYSSTGAETRLGPDADKWALGEKKRLEQELEANRRSA